MNNLPLLHSDALLLIAFGFGALAACAFAGVVLALAALRWLKLRTLMGKVEFKAPELAQPY